MSPDQIFTTVVVVLLFVATAVFALLHDKARGDKDIDEQERHDNLMVELDRYEDR